MDTTLSRRALNRATLARQHLLERVEMSVSGMVEHLVGMQAQNPLDPYYGLWARLTEFDPTELATMTSERQVVRSQVMRGTIHLLTAEDTLAVHPLTRSVLKRVFGSTQFAKDVADVDIDALLDTARSLLESRSMMRAELANELSSHWPDVPKASLAQAATYLIPVAQVPPRGVWGAKGQASWSPLDTFLGRPYGPGQRVDDLALRYLAAFGPAAVKDMRVWSGLTGLREVFDRLRPGLRTYRDENGVELFDLADRELPDPDTPAPPCLLPEYDNVLLGHDDRSRFFTGDPVPGGWRGNVLVDGVFAAEWKVDGNVFEFFLAKTALAAADELQVEAKRLIDLAWPDQVDEIRFQRL